MPGTHAPTHARPSLPVKQIPNLTPLNIATSGLHYTTAETLGPLKVHKIIQNNLLWEGSTVFWGEEYLTLTCVPQAKTNKVF